MRRALSWIVFLAVVAGAWTVLAPTSFGGENDYVIVDGTSMEPTYANGDLVVTRRQETYDVGDVITYQAPGDVDFPVIHRIVDVDDAGYVTQGDNRDRRDGWRPTDDDVHGAAWFSVPKGGHVLRFVRQVPFVLSVLAGWLVLAAFNRQERKEREEQERGGRDGGPPPGDGAPPGGDPAGGDAPAELALVPAPAGAEPSGRGRDELHQWLLTLDLDLDPAGRPAPRAWPAPVRWRRPLLPWRPGRRRAPRRRLVPVAVASLVGVVAVATLAVGSSGRSANASSLLVDGGVIQTMVLHDIDRCAHAVGPDECVDGP